MSKKVKPGRVFTPSGFRSNEMFNSSAAKNTAGWVQYHDKLTELAVSMFEWVNLPPEIDEIFLERVLFFQGAAVFFKDDVLNKYICLPFAAEGQWNIYDVPTRRRAIATNGYQNGDLNENNSVIIYNNLIRTPSTLDMRIYADRLWKIDQTIEMNLNAQKTPLLIVCDETQRLTMKNLYMQYDGNQPFIFGDKTQLKGDSIQAINTGAPFIADALWQMKSNIWNEALTYLGISNLQMTKKERLITDEVNRAMGGTIASRFSRLEARRQACNMINEMFGLNVQCNYREEMSEYASQTENHQGDEESEGTEDE